VGDVGVGVIGRPHVVDGDPAEPPEHTEVVDAGPATPRMAGA
jgi:hypothetical protein